MKNLILTADLFRIHNQKVMDTGKFSSLDEKLRDIEIQYKSVFDETDPDMYWDFYGDEEL
ncbi:MAG: hypothetical protein IJL67_10510 [Oscillospiraceae bacterium]|nr:hypothetical protein [Oscillospiraceae bacterium]